MKGHIVGEIKSVTVGSGRVRALMLYEMSLEKDDVPDELPALRGKVIGSMDDIRCTICGHKRDWMIGEDGMQQLLKSVERMHEKISV
jgi:hypothetical protein